jgi:DNA-binding NtrC family response regulator
MEQTEQNTRNERIDSAATLAKMARRSSVQKLPARLLVVDDEPDFAETLREFLVFKGFDVETAENGREALELVTSTRHYDLMITDLEMPEMDGLELLRLVRNVNENLPVIILTGHGTVENALQAIQEGAWNYFLKPVNTEKLILAVIQGISKSREFKIAQLTS